MQLLERGYVMDDDKDGNEFLPVEFTTVLPLDEDLLRSPNLVPRLTDEEVEGIGHMVVEDFKRDRNSRADWDARMTNALKLALQVTEKKTFPWEGAANVKFPLITIAALQYQSRAYPALVNGPTPVSARPLVSMPKMRMPTQPPQQPGQPPDPQAQAMMQQAQQQAMQVKQQYDQLLDRAQGIAEHMSYQILEEDEQWEENHDKALLIQAIMGCVFKKSYFDPIRCHNVSECVSPREIIVDYFTKDIEHAPRLTQLIYLSANECYERVARGIFSEFKEDSPKPEPTLTYSTEADANERQGITQQPQDHDAPYELLEQHRTLDLDGDGYAEPYTVTVRYDTGQVLRIVPRFTRAGIAYTPSGKLLRVEPICAFTKYPFIPSPDGGFYDLGFGALLGPINETIDSAINQLLDAGTLANAGGGFVGRGFKNKRGEYRFRPGEWKSVDGSGDDLRKNIFPLPAPQPSPTLFQLLTLLIEYGESIAGAADILQGKNPGQNTPAETSRAMVEQGMKVFNGIFKRTHRAQTQEFRKLYRLNTIFLSEDMPYYAKAISPESKAAAKLYVEANVVIRCAADPFYMSDAQRYNQASALLQAAHASPGYDLYKVNRYYLQALKVPSIDEFLPDPKGPFAVPPMPNPKIVEAQMKAQAMQLKAQLDFKLKLLELVQGAEKQQAEIKLLEAQVVQTLAQAKGVDTGHQIALIEAQIGAAKNKQEGTLEAIKILHDMMKEQGDGSDKGGMGSMAGSSGHAGAMGDAATAPQGTGGSPFGAIPTAGSPF
jgi:chaperonin GroES